MTKRHAIRSASTAFRWTSCTASPAAGLPYPDVSNQAAMEGTCCHAMAAEQLIAGTDPQTRLGLRFRCPDETWGQRKRRPDGQVEVTQAMIDAVYTAVDYVRQRQADTGGVLFVEQEVPLGHITGEAGAVGTADIIMIEGATLHVMDFKFGRHKVLTYEVLPDTTIRPNLQLACYALGALAKYPLFEIERYSVTIIQPFLNHISDYSGPLSELLAVGEYLTKQAHAPAVYVPSSDNCHFCRASGNCAAQTQAILSAFEEIPEPQTAPGYLLGDLYDKLPMVLRWAEAIAERTRAELLAGRAVTRSDGVAYKLVTGQKGDRKWSDADAVLAAVRDEFKLKQEATHNIKLKSPAQMEELAKQRRKGPPPILTPEQWNTIKQYITQAPGQPTVALATDPRPEISKDLPFEEIDHAE
jgi:hypothetical protein